MTTRPRQITPVLAALAALMLLGCGGKTCPKTRSASLLEPGIRRHLNLAPRREGISVRRHAQSVLVDIGLVDRVDAQVQYDGRPRPVVLPLRRTDHIWSIDAGFYSEGQAGLFALPLRIDTGASAQLSMSSGHAQRVGVTIVEEFPKGRSYTSFGPKDVEIGVLRAVRLGDNARIEPIQAQVECNNKNYHSLLGISAMELFGHAIFDWKNKRLILLPRGDERAEALRHQHGWAGTQWSSEPIRTRRDSIEARGKGGRSFVINSPLRWAEVEIAGRKHAALIDTGFSADVFAFEPLGLFGLTDSVTGFGFGRSAKFDSVQVAAPVKLAGQSFGRVKVIEPRKKGLNIVERSGFDVIIGLGLLERHPLWLDFEHNELRFWTPDTPMPDFLR